MKLILNFCLFIIASACVPNTEQKTALVAKQVVPTLLNVKIDSTHRVIHIFVALCDNQYQGIVPVPPKIGNGRDLNNNLYWGCGFGIRSYFKKSKEWKLLRRYAIDSIKLERLVFKHTSKHYYLVADAYNGKYIETCTKDFLNSVAGIEKDTLHIDNKTIGIKGYSKLSAYIGHDGLMDFNLVDNYQNTDKKQRDCIILACISKGYFSNYIKNANANPLVWTTGLMCPEAYTIHDALTGYVLNESSEAIRNRAALAYSTHQKCSLKAARHLLVTGF